MSAHRAEVQAIVAQPQPPDFENTLAALDRAGRALAHIEALFHTLCATRSTPELQQWLSQLVPDLAEHHQLILQDPALFQRVRAVWSQRHRLSPEQRQLTEHWWRDMAQAGAGLSRPARQQATAWQRELAALSTQFSQTVLTDQARFVLPLRQDDEVDGLPPRVLALAREQAAERGLSEPYGVITLEATLCQDFLRHAKRRDLREKVWRAWTQRGAHGGDDDNRATVRRQLELRHHWARLHGFASYAEAQMSGRMLRSVSDVWSLLRRVWARVLAHHRQECAQLQHWWGPETLAPWDWAHALNAYQVSQGAPDAQALRPYLSLDGLLGALFDLSRRLFGWRFERLAQVPQVHESVQTWAVRDEAGAPAGWLILDLWARPGKRPGSWMSAMNWQHDNPAQAQECRLPMAQITASWPLGERGASCLGPDEALVLFHEFGHALHALLSRVRFAGLSGTRVPRDACEWPSQWMERWLTHDAILLSALRHQDTGQTMPLPLARRWQQQARRGLAAEWLSYLASAVLDLAVHSTPDGRLLRDPQAWGRQVLRAWGLPPEITPVHDLPHFLHIFGGQDYAAAYYSYLWSDVLAQSVFDPFQSFEGTGRGDDRAASDAARALRQQILGVGHSRPMSEAFEAFLGRSPQVDDWLSAMGWEPPAAASQLGPAATEAA